jgi:hypothetical protein
VEGHHVVEGRDGDPLTLVVGHEGDLWLTARRGG